MVPDDLPRAHIWVHEEEGENLKFPTNNLGLRHTSELGILDADGNVKPEVDDILEVIASHDAMMSCGHLDGREERIGDN